MERRLPASLLLAALAGAPGPGLAGEVGTNDARLSDMGPDGTADFDALNPAVAYNPDRNEYLVVWEGHDVTVGEWEIFGQRIDAATGAEVGENDLRISDMGVDGDPSADAFDAAVAYNPTNREYLIVWSGDDGTVQAGDEFEIFGQRIDAATGAEVGENDFRISTMGPDGDASFDAVFPAVAYNPTDNEYLVVWQGDDDTPPLVVGENEIFGQRIDAATGAEVGENDFRISTMGPDGDRNFPAFEPAVVYNPQMNEYLVVWEGEELSGEAETYVQRIDAASGAEIGTDDLRISHMGPDGDPLFDAFIPAVAYSPIDNQYLVVWFGNVLVEDGDLPGCNDCEIYGQLLDAATEAEIGADDFRVSDMGAVDGDSAYAAVRPRVVFNPTEHEYLVSWDADDDTPPQIDEENETFIQRLDASTGAEIGGNDVRISDMGPDGVLGFGAFAADVAYSPSTEEYFVVWAAGDDTAPLIAGDHEIFGQRWHSGVLIGDDFEDAKLSNNWTFERGFWDESGGSLNGVPDDLIGTQVKARTIADPAFSGCDLCTAGAQLEAENGSGGVAEIHMRLLAWYAGRQTNVSVTLKPAQDKVVYRQKEDGVVLRKVTLDGVSIEEDIIYDVRITFDGTEFVVLLDQAEIVREANASAEIPFGTFGFQSRSADIRVHEVGILP